jgi:hypothetical protein
MLLSLLVRLENRRHVAVIAGTFVVVSVPSTHSAAKLTSS